MQGLRRDDDPDDHETHGVPDLSRLSEEQWLAALRPLSRNDRIRTQNTVPWQKVPVVGALIGELILEEEAAQARARATPPARLPSGNPPPVDDQSASGPRRQVNFRLGPGEHARLVEAARLFGMRPNTLARVLVVRGVDRALREARCDG